VAYAIVSRKKDGTKKKAEELPSTEEESPKEPPAKPHLKVGHREAKPELRVWIPRSAEDRDKLDSVICDVWNTYETPPANISDFTMEVLDELAPEGEWPTVPGDHASLHSLQAIVSFRIDELSQLDKTKSFAENLDAACATVAVPPSPMGPGNFAPGP